MVPGKSPGSWDNKYWSALGPPVEIPIATMRVGAAIVFTSGFSAFISSPAGNPRTEGSSLWAATLILLINSSATSCMWTEASRGLATKSNAPNANA